MKASRLSPTVGGFYYAGSQSSDRVIEFKKINKNKTCSFEMEKGKDPGNGLVFKIVILILKIGKKKKIIFHLLRNQVCTFELIQRPVNIL